MRLLKSPAIFAVLVGLLARLAQANQAPYAKANEEFADEFKQNNREYSLSLNQSSSSIESMPSFYSSSQASKFRVNVSNVCERTQMRVTIRLNKPFYGLIHAKERRKRPACFVEGTGEQSYTMEISFTLLQTDPNYCGVVSHHLSGGSAGSGIYSGSTQRSAASGDKQTTLSLVLVVRLHKTIEFSDDRYFLLSCANRCTKADCSQEANPQRSSKEINHRSAAITASESILAPVLRSSEVAPSAATSGNSSTLVWTTEKCDIMLDMKFQWLLKLCWILTFLLVFMLCVAFYLCLTLSGRRKGASLAASKTSREKRSSKRANKQRKASYAQSDANSSWSTLIASSNSTSSGLPTSGSEELNKIREDNSFLAQQNQQLMLANLLANSTKNKQILGYQESLNQLLVGQQSSRNKNLADLLAGRSIDSRLLQRSELSEEAAKRPLRRRRSIASSAAPILLVDSAGNARYKSSRVRASEQPIPLDESQRAKSRSQTTIHYEQRQDPFKAVPFNYLNNGYLSDGQVHSTDNHLDHIQPNFHLYPANQHNLNETVCHSLPPESIQLQAMVQQQQEKRWLNYPYKPSFVSPPEKDEDSNNNGRHVSSQFDPEQNSHELIGLIQQKHRQQMEQANRTAASLVPISPEQMPSRKQGQAWR